MAPCSYASSDLESDSPRFSDTSVSLSASEFPIETRLRGLRWRVYLGNLPPCPASIESLRRAAANCRRRYAELRRCIVVDPRMMEDVQKVDHLSVDNPLSQDPESVWGRFFKNADVQRRIESDLALLHPEYGTSFQSFGCQAMLGRILLVWALVHPQYGYQQGMHELLAPLVHVLRMDVTHLSQVRQRYEDPFEDRFDTPHGDNFSCSTEGRRIAPSFSAHSSLESTISSDEEWIWRAHPEDSALVEPDELGFNLRTMLLGSDSYGAEGELGALLSGRFVEHDAYCMFDALMRGQGGPVALADYYKSVNEMRSTIALSPVLEASAAVYHALALVDMPLYVHMNGLGVEPQFFALRWLRVLFSREFEPEKLLLIWDAVFAAPTPAVSTRGSAGNKDLPLGSFISCLALAILLHLRPTLLAASNATSCLQKLLCLPKNIDIRNLIENAKMLHSLAQTDVKILPASFSKSGWVFGSSTRGKNRSGSPSPVRKSHVLTANKVLQHHYNTSPEIMRTRVPESYWEERWINSVLPDVLPINFCDVQDMEEDSQDTASGHVHHTVVSNDAVRHRLHADCPTDGATSFSHHEDRKRDTSLIMPESLSDSEASTKSEDMTNDSGDYSTSTVGVPFRELNSEVAEVDPLRSHDKEPVLSSCERDSAAQECDASKHVLDCEAYQGQVIRHDFQDRIKLPQLQENSIRTATAKNGKNAEFLSKINNICGRSARSGEKGSETALQTLGHSMVEKIQVIESAMTDSSHHSNAGAAAATLRGNSELFSKAFLNGKAHVTVLSALTELRAISNLLLQM